MTTQAYQAAFKAGYTKEVLATCDAHEFTLLVFPSLDYERPFLAFEIDGGDFIIINNGHLWTFEDL